MTYARISLDRTGSGLGIERQRQDCVKLAEERGWSVVAEFSDNDISAYSGKLRPGYSSLLEYMRAGQCDVVVAWHVDRLHRSPVELEEYISVSESTSTTTVTVKAGELDLSTAAGRMVARMLGAAARHESEQKSERIRRKRRQDAEAGRAHGPLGYGYDDLQQVVPSQAKVVKEVATRLLGGDTLYGIAVDLNRRGVPTPGAGRWYHHQVTAILDLDATTSLGSTQTSLEELPASTTALIRQLASASAMATDEAELLLEHALGPNAADCAEFLAALTTPGVKSNGQIAKLLTASSVPAPTTTWRAANLRAMIRRGTLCGWRDFEPGGRGGGEMVAEGDWQAILTRDETIRLRHLLDSPDRRSNGRERRMLLSSILVCGRCGAPLGGYNSPTEGRKYACSSQPGLQRCGRLTVVADPVEKVVVAATLAALSDADLRARGSRRRTAVGIDEAEREIAEVRAAREEYAKDASAGRITRAEWFILREGLESREAAAKRVLGLGRPPALAGLHLVPTTSTDIETWWAGADLKSQREVIKLLIEKVVIQPAAHRGGKFDPSRVSTPIWRF